MQPEGPPQDLQDHYRTCTAGSAGPPPDQLSMPPGCPFKEAINSCRQRYPGLHLHITLQYLLGHLEHPLDTIQPFTLANPGSQARSTSLGAGGQAPVHAQLHSQHRWVHS